MKLNITFAGQHDIGFLYQTLKKHFERKGHHVRSIILKDTYLDSDLPCDIVLDRAGDGLVLERDIYAARKVVKESDFFIIRWCDDNLLRHLGLDEIAGKHNAVFKVHGTDLRKYNIPYRLHTWHTKWYHNEPLVIGSKDWSLLPLYQSDYITCIERPLDFEIMPKRVRTKERYIIHTPTGGDWNAKGSNELIEFMNYLSVPYRLIHGVTRTKCLKARAGASLTIDKLSTGGATTYGQYGMNTTESWYMKIPAFTNKSKWDYVFHPEIHKFHIGIDKFNVMDLIRQWWNDPKPFEKKALLGHKYVKRVHNPKMIAQQYLDVFEHIARA